MTTCQMVTLKEDTMSTAVKATIATFLFLVLIFLFLMVETLYTKGALIVGILMCALIGTIWMCAYAIIDDV